jgi:hypothetical protein
VKFLLGEDGRPTPLLAIASALYFNGALKAKDSIRLATTISKSLLTAAETHGGHESPSVVLLDRESPPRFVPVADDDYLEPRSSAEFH